MIDHSGIGTHIRGLLEGWREEMPDFHPTLLGDPRLLASRLPDPHRYPTVSFRARIYGLREQIAFPRRKTRGALLHCPHYNVALRHDGPLVVTIHDLIHMHERWGLRFPPARWYARWMLEKAIARAQRVFAVSQATADDLATRFGLAQDRISIAHNAPSEAFLLARDRRYDAVQFRREAGLPDDYLLTVGLYKPHKNLDFVLETLASLWATAKIRLALAVAGLQDKERPALARRLTDLGIADRVRVLGRLPTDRMPLLYGGAAALIHASRLEGFGLPIVEAQAVGTPVIAARISALREVAGEGALFFDPDNGDELAEQLLAMVARAELRAELVAKGRRNAERFSWRDTARKVFSVYEQVA